MSHVAHLLLQESSSAVGGGGGAPSYLAMEPMTGGRAAIVSLMMRLPCADEPYTPPGVTGVTIATSLVLLGQSLLYYMYVHE